MKLTLIFLLIAGSIFAADPVVLTIKDFTNARGEAPGAAWVTEADGSIHRTGGAGDLVSKLEYSSFEMEWEWKLLENGNSGLKYWVTSGPKGGKFGLEYQMIDDLRNPDAIKKDSRNTASIYDIKGAALDKVLKPAGEWNHSQLIVKDGVIQHFLNGKLAVEADTKGDDWKQRIAKSKYGKLPVFAPGKGNILLQDHGDEVWFRNLRIKVLP